MVIEDIKNILKDKLFLELDLDGKKVYAKSKNKPILKELINKYKDFKISELIYLFKNKDNLENLHIFCLTCGKKNKFIDIVKGYRCHCSKKCSTLDKNVQLKLMKTNLIRYGEKYYSKTNKHRKTLYKMWSDINFKNNIIKKSKQTKLQKYGYENYNNRQKAKQTCKERYGVEHNWASKDPKLNGQFTMEKRYGIKHCFSSKDPKLNGKTTCKERYGNEIFSKTNFFKGLWKDKNWVNKREQKRIKTLNLKYNGNTPIIDNIIKNKRYNTMKINKSFNKSKLEEQCYNLLLTKFNKEDIIRQYNNDLYPFNCDFYIPSKDLFIELNFHWTHGGEPFNKDNLKHLERLNLWKNKNTKFYKKAIDVWTRRDIKKLETFKKNNLNHKIFYTEEEFNEWFNTL